MATTTALERTEQIELPSTTEAPSRLLAEPLARLLLGNSKRDRVGLIGGTVAFALIVAIFWSNVRHFVWTWWTDANYSHGFLVPLISLYFANEAARRGNVSGGGGAALGSTLITASILGRLATILVPVGIVGDGAFVLGLAGVVALIAGRDALRRFAFPLAFLLFMVPLPIALYTTLATPLQLWVSRAASLVLNALGIPVLCQGNLMTLPGGIQMFVAEACSGMRQLTGFLALTTAVAFLSARPWWYRGVLIASSVPIAMTANVIRVIVTGLIMFYLGPTYASGHFHTVEGMLMLGIGLLLLVGECGLLNAAFVPEASGMNPAAAVMPPPRAESLPRWGVHGRVALALGLLGAGLAAETLLVAATELPRPLLKGSLASLPMRIGDWVGEDVPIDPDVLRQAQCDDYLNRRYVHSNQPGHTLAIWINYSRLGLNLRHSPEVCLPSGGWEKIEAETRVLEIARTGREAPHRLTRLAYQQGELVQGIGFWYYIFGEGAIERFVRGLPITSRSSHGRATRGSGLTVEVFCPGQLDPSGEALQEFAVELLEELEPLLPDDRAAYHRP